MTEVIWKNLQRFNGYSVSNTGLIRSDKNGGQIKAQQTTKVGKKSVTLWYDGKKHHQLVHRLVAEEFIPNPHNLPYVLHWDDVPDNNHVDNLRWGTQKDNMGDRVRNGNHPTGHSNYCKRGHEFTESNTRRGSKGERRCDICFRNYHREWQRNKTLKDYEQDVRH